MNTYPIKFINAPTEELLEYYKHYIQTRDNDFHKISKISNIISISLVTLLAITNAIMLTYTAFSSAKTPIIITFILSGIFGCLIPLLGEMLNDVFHPLIAKVLKKSNKISSTYKMPDEDYITYLFTIYAMNHAKEIMKMEEDDTYCCINRVLKRSNLFLTIESEYRNENTGEIIKDSQSILYKECLSANENALVYDVETRTFYLPQNISV